MEGPGSFLCGVEDGGVGWGEKPPHQGWGVDGSRPSRPREHPSPAHRLWTVCCLGGQGAPDEWTEGEVSNTLGADGP